jgi:hypothetical protein
MATVVAKPTYLELISKDEKSVKVEALKLKAQEAGLEVTREIFNIKTRISNKNNELVSAQRAMPYSVAKEYAITKEVAELQAQLEFVQAIKEERFSDAAI